MKARRSSECHYLRADRPAGEFTTLLPRAKNIQYDMDQAADNFYIRINDKGRNFRLVTAPVADPLTGELEGSHSDARGCDAR